MQVGGPGPPAVNLQSQDLYEVDAGFGGEDDYSQHSQSLR